MRRGAMSRHAENEAQDVSVILHGFFVKCVSAPTATVDGSMCASTSVLGNFQTDGMPACGLAEEFNEDTFKAYRKIMKKEKMNNMWMWMWIWVPAILGF